MRTGPGAAGLLGALLVVVAAAALAVPGARAEDAAPGSPAWVTASPVADSSDVSVRWEAVEGATKYQIAHSTDGGETWTPAAAIEAAPAGAEAAPEPAATLTGRHSLRLFSGGSLAQLAAAGEAACPGGIVIWVQDAAEEWFSYISGAPVFANARFVAAFPGGLDRRAVFVSLCEPAPAGAANTAQPVVDDGAADAPAEPVSHVISVRDASKSRIVRVRAGNDAGWGGWDEVQHHPRGRAPGGRARPAGRRRRALRPGAGPGPRVAGLGLARRADGHPGLAQRRQRRIHRPLGRGERGAVVRRAREARGRLVDDRRDRLRWAEVQAPHQRPDRSGRGCAPATRTA